MWTTVLVCGVITVCLGVAAIATSDVQLVKLTIAAAGCGVLTLFFAQISDD